MAHHAKHIYFFFSFVQSKILFAHSVSTFNPCKFSEGFGVMVFNSTFNNISVIYSGQWATYTDTARPH